jgi:transcriptional regulator with XRE-family HTH domain
MLNIEEFVNYALSASAFADKIGVQRSSMSHLLSGRNKPSLDFVMKILEVFPDVDLYWILTGKGSFPERDNETSSEIIKSFTTVSSNENSHETKDDNQIVIESPSKLKSSTLDLEDNEIEKIVLFYKNGTFKAYSL